MVLNLSPLASHLNESLCSLRFATKVRTAVRFINASALTFPSGEQHDDWNGQEADAGNWTMMDSIVLILHWLLVDAGQRVAELGEYMGRDERGVMYIYVIRNGYLNVQEYSPTVCHDFGSTPTAPLLLLCRLCNDSRLTSLAHLK